MLKSRIDQDLKAALLAGDKVLVTTLRGLKSAILYAEVASGSREEGLSDEGITAILAKEAKKRQESADLYSKGGSQDRAAAELAEKQVIERYLPQQLSGDELNAIIDTVIAGLGAVDVSAMGRVIGAVKQKVAAQADGTRVAQLVKKKLED